ncbi:putative ATPase, AAA-type, core, AAA-type ATPase domain-containing protein [Rosa chinensis]|uniref:Putative ATPase, AAA-type, core, AAA-type ATPase domain-containing protein n=1 Tax=Rosa chinensis TaxID=74649 RepID=A0A2P6SIQ7_ROSCH|nr:putative ATPase, AAA-type, core, AAA-type ATPase domain-containing protein [Rosa chinensis]
MILSNPFFLLVLAVCIFVAVRVLLYKTGLVYIVKKWWRAVEDCFHVYQSFKVPEFNESMQENQLYCKVTVYLNSLTSIEDSDFTNLVTGKKPNEIVLQLDPNQTIEDDFLGAKVTWQSEASKGGSNNCRNLVLKVRKADKRRILRPYLQHIHVVADELDQRKRDLRLYMNVDDSATAGDDFRNARWRAVPFTHPSTLETIAMEADLKSKIKSDLESFLKAKQYYNRLGRVWKRSFLLYGPSGTGKSSFVAAMANFLGYDVYDLDLSRVRDDSELKMLLLQTTSKSVILIEDLDRFFAEKSTAVSFSGISNFMDGLLNSCCAEERVMVFTMNSKDQVDPNFLRPGRIDVHIHFPLCDFTAFRNLATSYLGVKEHKLFPQVEEIFQSGSSLSPAEIGELMIANRNSPSRAIKSVITALQTDGDGRGRGRSDGRRGGSKAGRESPGGTSRANLELCYVGKV